MDDELIIILKRSDGAGRPVVVLPPDVDEVDLEQAVFLRVDGDKVRVSGSETEEGVLSEIVWDDIPGWKVKLAAGSDSVMGNTYRRDGTWALPQLDVTHPGGDTRTYPLALAEGQSVIVGRGNDAWILLNDNRASRHHCRIFSRDGAILIEDVGSTHHTFVNGDRITGETVLANDDVVSIGDSRITFKSAAAWHREHAALGSGETDPGGRPRGGQTPSQPEPVVDRPDRAEDDVGRDQDTPKARTSNWVPVALIVVAVGLVSFLGWWIFARAAS